MTFQNYIGGPEQQKHRSVEKHGSKQSVGRMLVYGLRAVSIALSTSARSVGIGDSHFLLLYSCLQMIMKTPQVLILGL